ncbi:MAG: hypothetical protein LAT75_12295 [Candidatus Cyclonatronum sp.]|uniref:hypothetical protein n=1 Tax=Cyclonatronum sp. TaxID=3024185 RepID=UPI0025C3417B|nr:hypothetical protein [Cyclonatronum sp.]MCH8487640.1 hypothetical protein [Cyclonatronum sp.]
MKTKLSVIILFLTLAAMACDTAKLTDAIDNFAPVIGLEPINTTGVVQLSDAATGDLITARTTVSFESLSGGSVIDMYSDPLLSVRVNNGFVNFGVSNDLEPSEDNPVRVRMRFEANGYQTLTRRFLLTETGTSDFTARMVRTSNPPSGVIIGTGSGGNSSESGEVEGDVVIRPSGPTGSGVNPTSPETEVKIAQGSILTDASGAVLTGALTVSTQFYDPTVGQALNALPDELRDAAESRNGLVLTAAEMSITDASGRRAARIGTGTAGRPLPGNAVLNNEEAPGDEYLIEFVLPNEVVEEYLQVLQLAILNAEEDGSFEFIDLTELIGTIVTVAPAETEGYTLISIQMNSELPFQYMLLAGLDGLVCSGVINVNRNGNSGSLSFEASQNGAFYSGSILQGRNSITVQGILPGSYKVSVNAAQSTATIESHDFCQNGDVTVDLPAPPPNTIDATVDLVLQCTNPSERLRVTSIPGATVQYRAEGAPSGTIWRTATGLEFDYNPASQALRGGTFVMNSVLKDTSYDVKILYDTETEEGVVTVTGERFTHTEIIDSDICG